MTCDSSAFFTGFPVSSTNEIDRHDIMYQNQEPPFKFNNRNIMFSILLEHVVNRIGGVMVSVLSSSTVDRGFEPRSGQIKDYKMGTCCFSATHAALGRKNKDWLARNQNNVSTCLPADCCFSELAL